MAVSRRLRYEVLRRDNHTCRYCGGSAPDVKLTVDHVVPTALGGCDEPENLVTACRDCNAGKAASSPDEPIVKDVSADALRWAEAMQVAVTGMLVEMIDRDEARKAFLDEWNKWRWESFKDGPQTFELPNDWAPTVDRFVNAGLPMEIIIDAVDTTMRAYGVRPENLFRYFCGCCWRRLSELNQAAQSVATVAEQREIEGGDA